MLRTVPWPRLAGSVRSWPLLAVLLVVSLGVPAQDKSSVTAEEGALKSFEQQIGDFIQDHKDDARWSSPPRSATIEDVLDDLKPYLAEGAIFAIVMVLIGGITLIRRSRSGLATGSSVTTHPS
jgi:hypothetical protein